MINCFSFYLSREEFDTIDSNESTNLIGELVIATDLRKVCYILL